MNRPLANALPTSWLAISISRSGSAVEAITNSTGKSPPPGSEGGMSGMIRTPGICASLAEASRWSSWEVRSRSLHGLMTMPPKPTVGKVIWKVASVSGKDSKTSLISRVKSVVCSIVELAEACTMPNTTPWSSAGASSRCENM